MPFIQTAQNARVDDGHILRASLQKADGSWQDAEIDLNQHIGNNNGRFDWSGADFAGSAENISFSLEGAANQPILRAALRDGEGNLNNTDLNLEEWLNNNDGQFAWNS